MRCSDESEKRTDDGVAFCLCALSEAVDDCLSFGVFDRWNGAVYGR